MTPIKQVGMRITELRTKRSWTARELAERAGRLEAPRHDPTLTVLEKLAKALKVPIERLLK